MKKVKIALSALAMTLAIGGAYASKAYTPVQGQTKLGEFPGQTQPCENRAFCDVDLAGACTIDEGSTLNIKLYDVPSSCQIQLQGQLIVE